MASDLFRPEGLRRATALLPALMLLMPLASVPARSQAQVQLACSGTLLDARGSAELRRQANRFSLSLGVESKAASADEALETLQVRLAAVRRELQSLGVSDLEVTSPNTWQRAREGSRPAVWVATLRVSGTLALQLLQPLVRRVGGLPGVTLSPVQPQADSGSDEASRRTLLREAYQDALRQARELAAVMGLANVRPLQVQVEGAMRPVPMRAMADVAAAPPFDPRELPDPVDRLSLQVSFCAR